MSSILTFKRLVQEAWVPQKAHDGDLGYDLHAIENVVIPGMQRKLIRTGIACNFPTGYGAILKDRSSVASKQGLFVHAGVIDSGYTGEILVLLFNSNTLPVNIAKHAKIAQMILVPVYDFSIEETAELQETERGAGGFGSTGI